MHVAARTLQALCHQALTSTLDSPLVTGLTSGLRSVTQPQTQPVSIQNAGLYFYSRTRHRQLQTAIQQWAHKVFLINARQRRTQTLDRLASARQENCRGQRCLAGEHERGPYAQRWRTTNKQHVAMNGFRKTVNTVPKIHRGTRETMRQHLRICSRTMARMTLTHGQTTRPRTDRLMAAVLNNLELQVQITTV